MDFLKPIPLRVSPVLPLGLAVLATGFCFFVWLVGEAILSPLFGATLSNMNENGLQVANGLRLEWIAFPVLIAVLLWIWAGIVLTRRRQATPQGNFLFMRGLLLH